MKPTNPETLELYRIADLILEKGGGSYFSSGRYYLYLGLYQQLFNLWMGKALGKRVVVAPQSIGPFNKRIDELCVAKVLRGADVVMVREPVSKALLESLDVVCSLVPDTAFLGGFLEDRTECVDTIIGALTDNFLNIAVTVLDWRWAVPDVRDSATAIPAYLDKCAQALGRIQQEYPLRVVIVPQVTAGARDDDTDVSNSLAARLEGIVADVKVIRGELSVSDCCRLYGAMDLVLASRLHSAIMAIIQGVPAVALSYQPKSRGVFSLLALNDFVFDIETFSADELFACIKDILENHEAYRIRIEKAANAAHHEVNQQFDKLIKPLLKQLL
jgi:colanic acid/amylovoran biosynthesis protein